MVAVLGRESMVLAVGMVRCRWRRPLGGRCGALALEEQLLECSDHFSSAQVIYQRDTGLTVYFPLRQENGHLSGYWKC